MCKLCEPGEYYDLPTLDFDKLPLVADESQWRATVIVASCAIAAFFMVWVAAIVNK